MLSRRELLQGAMLTPFTIGGSWGSNQVQNGIKIYIQKSYNTEDELNLVVQGNPSQSCVYGMGKINRIPKWGRAGPRGEFVPNSDALFLEITGLDTNSVRFSKVRHLGPNWYFNGATLEEWPIGSVG